MQKGAPVLLAGLALSLAFSAPSRAADFMAAAKCAAGQLKAGAKKVGCEFGADSKVAAKGGSADFAKCDSGFSAAFGKVVTKGGCETSADTTSIENKVDAFVADVNAELAVGVPNNCQSKKVKAAGKKASCELAADSKVAGHCSASGSADFSKCEGKFSSAWDKVEVKGGCNTTGDATAIESKVDSFVSHLTQCLTGGSCADGGGGPAPCETMTGGFCWFLAAFDQGCDVACAAAGRAYDSATATFAGSSGTDANCQALITDLGLPLSQPVLDAMASGMDGLGCTYTATTIGSGNFASRFTAPPTTARAAGNGCPPFRRICACQ